MLEYYPQSLYKDSDKLKLNNYGSGAFCDFSISNDYRGEMGVHAFYIDDKLKYESIPMEIVSFEV